MHLRRDRRPPVAERALERASAVRLPDRPPRGTRIRLHQRREHAFEERGRHDGEVSDARPPRHGDKLPRVVDEADTRHALPAPIRVLLCDLEERLLALAVAGDVDERVRAQELFCVVRDVRAAEDDQRVRTRRLELARDREAAVPVPDVHAETDDVGVADRRSGGARRQPVDDRNSERVAVGPLRMFLDVGLQQRDRVGQVHGGIHSRVHLHEPDVHCVARPCVCHLLLPNPARRRDYRRAARAASKIGSEPPAGRHGGGRQR